MKITIMGAILVTLTACSPLNHRTTVDNFSLLHSMIYTQRHLLALEMQTEITKNERSQLLLLSYCDLIQREFVYAENTPEQCKATTSNHPTCIANFHRCVAQCPTPKKTCQRCEAKAAHCLDY